MVGLLGTSSVAYRILVLLFDVKYGDAMDHMVNDFVLCKFVPTEWGRVGKM